MAIAEVKDVRNLVFINGSPASNGQMIDYGDVIETYNIDIGLEESFKSKLIENDGILTIEFLAEKPKKPEQMRIKPHFINMKHDPCFDTCVLIAIEKRGRYL